MTNNRRILSALLASSLLLSFASCEKETKESSATPISTGQMVEEVPVISENNDDGTVDDSEEKNDDSETAPSSTDTEIEDNTGSEDTEDTSASSDSDKKYIMHIPSSNSDVYEILSNCGGSSYSNSIVAYDEVMLESDVEYAMAEPKLAMASDTAVATNEIEYADEAEYDSSEDYSQTNTQVEGIDEADIVKTDGDYIYVLKDNRKLVILSAEGEDMSLVSKTTLISSSDNFTEDSNDGDDYWYSSTSAYGKSMYVSGDTLALIVQNSYYYDGWINGDYTWESEEYTSIYFYDISDRENPVETARFGQDGYYVDSRMKDGEIYLITSYNVYTYDTFDIDSPETYIPSYHDGGTTELIPLGCIVYPDEPSDSSYIVISRYNTDSCERTATKAAIGMGSTVYMNNDYLYIASTEYYDDISDEYQKSVYTVRDYESGYRTVIFKFSLGDEITTYAVGNAKGELLNQYSLDEYDGNLRIVTTVWGSNYSTYTDEELGFTNYKYYDSGRTNALYVFDDTMNMIGCIKDLAQDETVKSVRFSGETGYFVTFRNTDPLFTVNLSDPYNPTIMSTLKIPGFSSYLHPYSSTLLFGFGQSADEDTGWTTGMKLSMFDISDPYDVSECDKLEFDEYWSEALYNSRAILVSPEKGLIGFPISDGYMVYSYSEDGGFEEVTELHLECDWNGNARGLYSGDIFYIISSSKAFAYSLDSFDLLADVEY